jgi:hypothetical protein
MGKRSTFNAPTLPIDQYRRQLGTVDVFIKEKLI